MHGKSFATSKGKHLKNSNSSEALTFAHSS